MAGVAVVIGRGTENEVVIVYHRDDGSFTVYHPEGGMLPPIDKRLEVEADTTLGQVATLCRDELRRLVENLDSGELNPQPLPP